jgi:hypothetical protein
MVRGLVPCGKPFRRAFQGHARGMWQSLAEPKASALQRRASFETPAMQLDER